MPQRDESSDESSDEQLKHSLSEQSPVVVFDLDETIVAFLAIMQGNIRVALETLADVLAVYPFVREFLEVALGNS